MNVELFAHPLSFRRQPQAQADRLAAHGADGVRLAFSYHGGRWLLTTSDPCAVADFRAGQWFRDEAAPSTGTSPPCRFSVTTRRPPRPPCCGPASV